MRNRIQALPVLFAAVCLFAFGAVATEANEARAKSPAGAAATQIGDHWIEVTYSRPILRGRTGIFGAGETYGETVNGRAPVWRVGADVTTRVLTEMDLEINGTRVKAGEYSLFIELKEGSWTAILSSQAHMTSFDREMIEKGMTWGSHGYNAEHDVVRAPMLLETVDMSIDQMSIFFANVTETGGALAVAWEDHLALMPFKVAR